MKLELKQYTLEEMEGFDEFKRIIKPKQGSLSEAVLKVIDDKLKSLEKQETLEEAAERTEFERYSECLTNYTKQRPAYRLGFVEGAKWQKETKGYDRDDVDTMLDILVSKNMCSVAGDELINEFKKKHL